MSCRIECRAKINLYLDITGRRDDGYHDIETVFQPVSLADIISIDRTESGIDLSGNDDTINWGRGNLCYRAAERILSAADYRGGVRIEVEKNIPHGAGLGGGSSDAAGVLAGLNSFLGLKMPQKTLFDIALEIGSDVPFFLYNRPAIGRGRGELLESVKGIKGVYMLIVIPEVRVNTAEAYKKIDLMLTKDNSRYKLELFLEGLDRIPGGKIQEHNSFEESISAGYPEVRKVLSLLRKNSKAIFSSLSGSGSACFSVFADRDFAENEYRSIAGKGYTGLVVEPREKTIKFKC